MGVLVAGHYPLIDHARSAVLLFNKRHYSRYHGMLAWACLDFLPIQDRYPMAGDHAAGWETSHMMALHPGTVDLGALPPKGLPLIGVNGAMAPHDATAAFGKETLEASADAIVREVAHRLANRSMYMGHGQCLAEGLWKTKA